MVASWNIMPSSYHPSGRAPRSLMVSFPLPGTSGYRSESGSVSDRDDYDDFDFPHGEHDRTAEADRTVHIVIKDASDTYGKGMAFEVRYLDSFKNAFDSFKQASCVNCRAVDKIRFKTNMTRIHEEDTPKELGLKHNTTTEIRAWSNVAGLQCASCQIHGYPKADAMLTSIPRKLSKQTPAAQTVTVVIQDQTGFETNIKMLSTAPLEKLMEAYATRSLRDPLTLRFYFEGERLTKNETSKELGLVDHDIIEVYIEQFGGQTAHSSS
ncbi:Small ubiquitin-related modifier 2 [Vermiconidia calcicola]|uniref:Small ubiquitin-related modifier 2 n=1 Tax=Vermiconidia calcicola TaxID=1690605 RepID=A0ACC3MJA5_9PEZI|nr:Small ubiquitin-related modifier 2 [Vermiconidia calcicola]